MKRGRKIGSKNPPKTIILAAGDVARVFAAMNPSAPVEISSKYSLIFGGGQPIVAQEKADTESGLEVTKVNLQDY